MLPTHLTAPWKNRSRPWSAILGSEHDCSECPAQGVSTPSRTFVCPEAAVILGQISRCLMLSVLEYRHIRLFFPLHSGTIHDPRFFPVVYLPSLRRPGNRDATVLRHLRQRPARTARSRTPPSRGYGTWRGVRGRALGKRVVGQHSGGQERHQADSDARRGKLLLSGARRSQ